MNYYLYVVVYDLRSEYGNRYYHRKAIEKTFKGMNNDGLELCKIDTKFQEIFEGMQTLIESSNILKISAGCGPETRSLMEKIDKIHKDWDGIHTARSCWLVISTKKNPDELVECIRERAKQEAEGEAIFPNDRLIVTQAKLSCMGMHPDKREEIENWLISKGHDNLI